MTLTSKTFVPVPTGGTYLEISENYHEAFENGYMITIDEIKEHLRVKNWWVSQTFSDTVKHIQINTIARQALKKYPDRRWEYLYLKKRVFYKRSYYTFIIANTVILDLDGNKKQVDKIPTHFVTRSDILVQYKGIVNTKNFYEFLNKKAFKKYLVFNMPRYDKQEVDDYFASLIHL